MIDLSKFEGRTSDKYVVKHTTDDSGDYTNHYYTLIAVMCYGPRTIGGEFDNPHDAIMFASAPEMIAEIIELREKVAELEERITTASTRLAGTLAS